MDELNELGNSIDVEDIVEYFSKMDLTDEQRKDREDMAEKFNDFLLIFLNLIAENSHFTVLNYDIVR